MLIYHTEREFALRLEDQRRPINENDFRDVQAYFLPRAPRPRGALPILGSPRRSVSLPTPQTEEYAPSGPEPSLAVGGEPCPRDPSETGGMRPPFALPPYAPPAWVAAPKSASAPAFCRSVSRQTSALPRKPPPRRRGSRRAAIRKVSPYLSGCLRLMPIRSIAHLHPPGLPQRFNSFQNRSSRH